MATHRALIGNCAEVLKTIPAESIDCCVTSPPYWGLRDYKTEPLVWDAVEGCDHEWGEPIPIDLTGGTKSTSGNGKTQPHLHAESCLCSKCGAWRGQLGLEPSPQLYIKHLVGIFDEVKRVLKPSGTCWVNLGDSYASQGGPQVVQTKNASHDIEGAQENRKEREYGVQDKCLVQIPSRFALSMTETGWILRNELIWHKPNCMPSSVKDRFTVDFEKFFFFTKSKRYYFEPQYESSVRPELVEKTRNFYGPKEREGLGRPLRDGIPYCSPNGRNKRCVWTISTKPYSGAHFAVFPPELIETPIKAGCPTNGTVLDPFGGSGTTAKVARSLGRSSIIIELNPAYLDLQNERALLNVPDITEFKQEGGGA